jgi:hypothetical protein
MSLKRKQMQLRQKAYFEQKLQDRLSYLSGKGVVPPKTDKDPLVKKLKANIRAMNRRLKLIADNEKITEDMAKIKADRAAGLMKEQEPPKSEKPKKSPEEGKEKKPKAEKKPGAPKAPEGGKDQKPAEPSGEGKPAMKKKKSETSEAPAGEPAGQVKENK